MAKPVINKITPFDANYEKIITMTYFGNMVYSNRIIIYDTENMTSVFDDTVASFSLSHIIPSGVLTNGKKYAIQCQMFDSEGIASVLSDKAYFWVFETPAFYFANLNNGDTISSASLNVSIVYEQADWEDIGEYRFFIYNENKELLNESEILYDSDDISYSFRGLESDNIYYIRCFGNTVNGMEIDTGYVKILVKYENPNTYARIYAECDEKTGIVKYNTNFVLIEPKKDDYDYNNGFIDLIGKSIIYDNGFLVPDDFTMTIRGKNMYHSGTVLSAKNDEIGFTLSSYIYEEGKLRYKITVPNGVCNYILYSDALVFDDQDLVTINIRRINNIYSIKCFVEYEYKEQTDMWFGSVRPTKNLTKYDIWINTDASSTVKVNKDNVTIFYQNNEPDNCVLNNIWIGGE